MGVRPKTSNKPGGGAKGGRPTPPSAGAKAPAPVAAASSAPSPAADAGAEAAPRPAAPRPPAAPVAAPHGGSHGAAPVVALPDHAVDLKKIGVYLEDETFVTYEGSRIPWWVRLMWIGFWLLVSFYTINYMIPDMKRWFGGQP